MADEIFLICACDAHVQGSVFEGDEDAPEGEGEVSYGVEEEGVIPRRQDI